MLFISIDDETGIATGIWWPVRFEAQRRTVLSAALVGLKDWLQREGIVTHIIIDKVIDYTPCSAGLPTGSFRFGRGRGDGPTHEPRERAHEQEQERGEIRSSE
ncbi:hypothetical protein [Novosphingobium sp. P6W]|uniref:hypothetical protein n=1 Tax=Novosphingobium sp. P6W TaxID=1609758 RepID=UPI0005C30934|nr:hypothetical protein [Novosphingobium sp. P6W]AXB80125.1 DNA polymerase III subunit alpha [Novosphingobium sp. P6W]KIS29979.1 hypothetical protein TQ38_25430 [Novosphingobium sp. P6W]